jgi:hypothetical protein
VNEPRALKPLTEQERKDLGVDDVEESTCVCDVTGQEPANACEWHKSLAYLLPRIVNDLRRAEIRADFWEDNFRRTADILKDPRLHIEWLVEEKRTLIEQLNASQAKVRELRAQLNRGCACDGEDGQVTSECAEHERIREQAAALQKENESLKQAIAAGPVACGGCDQMAEENERLQAAWKAAWKECACGARITARRLLEGE